MMKILLSLLKTKRTVFTTQEIKSLFPDVSYNVLTNALIRSRELGELSSPIKGIRTLPNFNENELACKLYPNGYISLESVLYDEGIIFQWYGESTRVIWNNTREKVYHGHKYIAHKIKDSILNNRIYIREKNNYFIATPERALCDLCYLQKKLQIDNIDFYNNDQSKYRFLELFPLYPKYVEENVRKSFKRKI